MWQSVTLPPPSTFPLLSSKNLGETNSFTSALPSAIHLATALSTYVWTGASRLTSLETLSNSLSQLAHEFDKCAHEKAAKLFGEHICWPEEVFNTDADELCLSRSLVELIRCRQLHVQQDRFNETRCRQIFSDDPEFDRLLVIAREGVTVDVSPQFKRLSVPPPRRKLHRDMPGVFRHHALALWREGKALLLPTSVACLHDVHFSAVHWTAKPGKPEGRFLGDCTNGPNDQSLNTVEVKEMISRRFGDLHHPSILDILSDIVALGKKHAGLHNLRLWKDDIVGAFSHFNYGPASAPLFAFEIDDHISMIQYTGMFGWTGSPFAFGPLSRALGRVVAKRVSGRVHVYVDDFMGISPASSAAEDQYETQQVLFAALGSNAVNIEKSSVPSLRLDMIGWHIDLISSSIRPSDRAIRKLMYTFFSVRCSRRSRVHLERVQALASLASRYSTALVGMRPFVQPLFENCRVSNQTKWVRLSQAACVAIHVWRAVAIILYSDASLLAVPISFLVVTSSTTLRIQSDAGPYALGVVLDRGDDSSYIAHISYTLPFDASDPRYQNIREFMGGVLGLLMLGKLGYRNEYVHWVGDNISSLSWAERNYVNSSPAQAVFMLYSWLSIYTHLVVSSTEHCPGVHMGDIDGLSRGFHTRYEHFCSPIPCTFSLSIDPLFVLCDPTVCVTSINSLDILTSILPLLADIIRL